MGPAHCTFENRSSVDSFHLSPFVFLHKLKYTSEHICLLHVILLFLAVLLSAVLASQRTVVTFVLVLFPLRVNPSALINIMDSNTDIKPYSPSLLLPLPLSLSHRSPKGSRNKRSSCLCQQCSIVGTAPDAALRPPTPQLLPFLHLLACSARTYANLLLVRLSQAAALC